MSGPKRPADPGKLQPGSPGEPELFGKYYLHGLIARGGMAEVYRARLRDEGGPDMLAIKVMRPQLAREARFVDMFNREGQLAMLLQDASIVRTFEVGRIEGRHYIAMEYIGGRDLTQVLRRCQETNQRIPVPHAVYIGSCIAAGLDHAHNLTGADGRPLNIVNRDVSPSNVRLSYGGDVKLLDFGIAQALMKFTSEIGVLKGKFSYMSPEQIRGMPVDARTDIFSAGIILHEMLTTEKLFRGDTEFQLMEKVRKADIDPPSKFNRRVIPELDAIVAKALARDVNERYQRAADLARDLQQLLESYKFQQKELKEFMRGRFRKEFTKEHEEITTCLESVPLSERARRESAGPEISIVAEPEEPSQAPANPGPNHPDNGARPQRPTPAVPGPAGQPPPEAQEGKSGFWSRLRGKLKK